MEDELDPLRFGDVVYFRPDQFGGLLQGDVARHRCGVMAVNGEPANFEDSLFKIFPALGFRWVLERPDPVYYWCLAHLCLPHACCRQGPERAQDRDASRRFSEGWRCKHQASAIQHSRR